MVYSMASEMYPKNSMFFKESMSYVIFSYGVYNKMHIHYGQKIF